MARKKTLGGKAPQAGCKVSHSHRKTKRKWMPNIQRKSLYSATLKRRIRMTITTSALRTVDRAGGIDNYLLTTPVDKLTPSMRQLQTTILRRQEMRVS
ncbi:MAG: 50S ribosomal protein L28 [Magnetococcales bacterium]|nr:50S ribosomal protein L28 [Magnetococcales bacterium]